MCQKVAAFDLNTALTDDDRLSDDIDIVLCFWLVKKDGTSNIYTITITEFHIEKNKRMAISERIAKNSSL